MKKLIWLCALSVVLPLVGETQTPPANIPVTLAWDHDGVATDNFVLERKLGTSGTYEQAKSVPATSRTVVDTVPMGQVYCWQVRAKNAYFLSEPSNEVCLVKPDRPINLRIQ